MRWRLAAALALAVAPDAAMAHIAGAPPRPWSEPWSFEPWALVPLLLGGLAYLVGQLRLRSRSGPGRTEIARRGALFWAGILVLAAAVTSPLHAAGAHSFAAHMLEHELLMLAAAPLLVAARPLATMLWAFPAGERLRLGRWSRGPLVSGGWKAISDPVAATALQAAALWIWHLPSLFDRALASEAWHAAQHLSFLISALVFWSAMLGPRRNVWIGALCLFATATISGALGALMALSPSPWYAPYAQLGLAAFGLTPAQDQQLAGVLMWVPGGAVHAIAALWTLAPFLRETPGPRAT